MIDNFYAHIPYGVLRLANLIVFLRIIPKLTNRLEDEYKENIKNGDTTFKYRQREYEYNKGTMKQAQTVACTYKSLPVKSDTVKKDLRTRSGYMEKHANDTKFVTVFGDKNGRVNRNPFSTRKYNETTINNAWDFIQKEVDTGNVWK
jgi:hypothetical protein